MFPQDKYTPHGYLDNPAHAWKTGPGGVLRSRPAIGMGWFYPSFPHGYNYVWHYIAHLQLGFQLGGQWLLTPGDFEQAGLSIYSDYHSKNWLSFIFEGPEGLRVRTLFYLAETFQDGGDALGCLVEIRNRGNTSQKVTFVAALDYQRQLGQGLDWTSGLYARRNGRGVTVAGFQEGAALHLRSNGEEGQNWTEAASLTELRQRLVGQTTTLPDPLEEADAPDLTEPGQNVVRKIAALEYSAQCEPETAALYQLVVARDVSEWRAVKRAERLLADDATAMYEGMSRGKAEDDAFWQNAPKLSGDWPEHIRRGLVYDFETLRMMVRRPAGIYRHAWDAMQIQVPRTVLAEVALDMLILSYADPEAAQEALFGAFADAPEPNVPCSREDGSYNMVALDGSPCGTAPEWCFPFHCIELVYRRTGNRQWLAALYPHLEAYINFWQRERTDGQGRPFYKCSWEAGQDNSARFMLGEDPTGGAALGEHLWPVDLQASLAQACWLLAAWGDELGVGANRVQRWNELGGQHAALMQQMWQADQNWFHDFDRRTNTFTNILDTMQLAPLLCRVARPEQVTALHSKLENPPLHGQVFPALMWPSIVFCLVEACSEAGRSDLAARHGWTALDGVYRWMDSRPASVAPDSGGMPGVGREYWPQVSNPQANPPRGGGGTEVYGWGCLSAYLLLRYVVGVQEERPQRGEQLALWLRPNLPQELMQPNKLYRVQTIPCRNAFINVTYTVRDDGQLAAKVQVTFPTSAQRPPYEQDFVLANGQGVRVAVSSS